MKKKLAISILTLTFSIAITSFFFLNEEETNPIETLRAKHQKFLDNSPYKATQNLTRLERLERGLPPNAYYEQMWELSMDPNTGRPMPERLIQIQGELNEQRQLSRGVGGDNANPWVDRGPNDQGGRTRGVMFDPNDINNANPNDDYTRVFAGGVSGGLWVNDDITDGNSSWSLVTGAPGNISVTCIISDPNDSDVFYVGSGESYTSGDAVGRGIWKSEDGGVTWTNIFGGYDSFVVNSGTGFVNGIFYINDIIARDNGGSTELYAAVSSAAYDLANAPDNFNGLAEMGVYKSTDGGANWTRFNITHNDGSFKNPNDLELDIDNNIWFSTTSNAFGNAGGDIYKSTDGVSFTLENTIPGASRTEIEPSATNADTFWVAANVGGQANLYTTTNGFTSFTTINEPNDVDLGISPADYARNQAFYNLPIESDQNGFLYVGGIDLFRSTTGGITWGQISKWSNNNNLAGLNVSLVHADQHAIVFRPGSNDNEAVFANDGGVYYASDLTNTGNGTAIQARNRDYNTVQFYYGTIDEVDGADGDDISGGTQDNGTQFTIDAGPGANAYFDPVSGDGGFTEIDDSGAYVIATLPGNNSIFINYPVFNNFFGITTLGGGSFINEAELDKNLDILYANASGGATNRIERVTEFLPGGAAQTNTAMTNALMNSRPSALKVSPYTTSVTTLFVGLRNGRLLRVNFANLAPSWTNITGPGFVGSISDIELGQSEQEIFVTMHNYGVTSVWASTDGGNNWTNIEGNLPDIPVQCILQNPLIPEELIIGTDLGVWATPDYTDPNPTWVQAYNGMSDVTVVDLDLRASDNTILAATHGRGMFTSQFTDTPLSILENQFSDRDITLYPTVSNGDIKISSNSFVGVANMNIYNINGQEVHKAKLNISSVEENVKLNLGSGMYFVNIAGDNFSVTKKIIIK
ncbi:T9SS type A sorting domain-containing protein [Winogradskyella sp. 3972H.M.0a.05]|uniref:T9SS type A sorting domain-containing protein n=1 Tax=Winogradskyella sp. 3972H.M.0a.05 TaxID=2950277 RepID=UPI003392038C